MEEQATSSQSEGKNAYPALFSPGFNNSYQCTVYIKNTCKFSPIKNPLLLNIHYLTAWNSVPDFHIPAQICAFIMSLLAKYELTSICLF